MRKILVVLAIAMLIVACSKTETAAPAAAASPATADAPAPAGAPPAAGPAAAGNLSGKVVETMDSGGYTYMKVRTADGEQWAATPQVKVKKGDTVTIVPQMTAEKFESSTLGRTFDRIVFGTFVAPGGAADAPVQQAAAPANGSQFPPAMQAALKAKGIDPATMGGMQAGMQGGGMQAMGTPADHMKPRVEIGDVKVAKAEGADARTVAEVWGSRAALADKEVVVRGKVVKFLGGIMGTNFMHVRDGSGSESKGDHDLTVTTNDVAAVGDVVTLRGTVLVDKDFGAGYRYPVIVQKATLRK